jgi:SAM-dependent methyltransferase
MLDWIRRWTSQAAIFPQIESELFDIKEQGLLRGTVLNAGCGWRDISHMVEGTLVNLDISWPEETRTNIDIISPLDNIPRPAGTFDTVICIAVLEHVENPEAVTAEMFRVLKPGGHLVATVPFLQPEHKVPTDFQRYTRDGLSTLVTRHGFVVEEIKPVFSVYHTLHWIVYEWLHIKSSVAYKVLRVLLLPPLALLAKKSSVVSDKVASGFRVIARKP